MAVEHDLTGLWPALAAGAGVLAGGTALFAAGLVGGGDVKLAAAVAVWVGTGALSEFLVVTTLAGGLLALAMLPAQLWRRLRGHGQAGRGVPYGVAIVAAALWTLAGRP
jgi:prepilin peptidase CpaA